MHTCSSSALILVLVVSSLSLATAMAGLPPPKRLKLSVQVIGTSLPIQVQGDNLAEIISAAKAQLPDCLRAPIHCIVLSTDQQGRNPLDNNTLAASSLEGNSPQNPLWLRLLKGDVKVEPNYIERDFAKLDDLITEMENSGAVLYFCGPSGTGKTTTLNKLYERMQSADQHVCYYVNAKNQDRLAFPADGAYIFIDEAQYLDSRPLLCQDLVPAKSYCLAFSPVLTTQDGGLSFLSGHLRYTRMYYFRPYTPSEVDELKKKNIVKTECMEEAEKLGVFIPRMFSQCRSSSEVKFWVNAQVTHLLGKVQGRLSSDDSLRDVLIKASMGETLADSKTVFAISSGFFYVSTLEDVHLIFPPGIMMPQLYERIRTIYSLIRGYGVGAAFEFLVHAQLQIAKNTICCMAANPSALGESKTSKSYVNACREFEIEQCVESIHQRDYDDVLTPTKNCCLVKLRDGHYGVDFLIIRDTHGSDSKTLFFVQTSVQKHQSRSGKKLSCLYDEKPFFGEKSVLHFYSGKLGIQTNHCFYVYACPEIPHNDTFSTDPAEREKVYFLKVDTLSEQ